MFDMIGAPVIYLTTFPLLFIILTLFLLFFEHPWNCFHFIVFASAWNFVPLDTYNFASCLNSC